MFKLLAPNDVHIASQGGWSSFQMRCICVDQFWSLLGFGCLVCKRWQENINSFELNSGVLQIAPRIEFRGPEG